MINYVVHDLVFYLSFFAVFTTFIHPGCVYSIQHCLIVIDYGLLHQRGSACWPRLFGTHTHTSTKRDCRIPAGWNEH